MTYTKKEIKQVIDQTQNTMSADAVTACSLKALAMMKYNEQFGAKKK